MGFFKRLSGSNTSDENQPEVPSGPFRMTVSDIFSIANRGIVLTGRIESGSLTIGDPIMIANETITVETNASAIEMFPKPVKSAKAGDTIGILLPGDVPRDALARGMVVTKRGEA